MLFDCLIIDDEKDIACGVCEYFNLFGVSSHCVHTADEALEFLINNSTKVILLDVNLGDESGFALCKTLREKLKVPILFISARTSNEDMLLGLGIGGDDYITKPFSLAVLLAKVKAVLSRYSTQANLSKCRLQFDESTGYITLDGIALELTNMEHRLLRYFLDNPNRIIEKDELFNKVWGDNFAGDGTLNVHIRRLREKIEADPTDPKFIKTIWGVGYEYREDRV